MLLKGEDWESDIERGLEHAAFHQEGKDVEECAIALWHTHDLNRV